MHIDSQYKQPPKDNSHCQAISTLQLALKESLVLLFEVLRQAECPFAVALFSSKERTRVVKQLHTPFTRQTGEKIMESLAF